MDDIRVSVISLPTPTVLRPSGVASNTGTKLLVLDLSSSFSNVPIPFGLEEPLRCFGSPLKPHKVITETPVWKFDDNELRDPARQQRLLDPEDPRHLLALSQIQEKLRGYRSQDQDKGKYDPARFVDLATTRRLLAETQLRCVYCQQTTMILYPRVREPRQWTLERVDNAHGHNRDNVEIACLTCNLRRRTMHQERYHRTKTMVRVVKLDATN